MWVGSCNIYNVARQKMLLSSCIHQSCIHLPYFLSWLAARLGVAAEKKGEQFSKKITYLPSFPGPRPANPMAARAHPQQTGS